MRWLRPLWLLIGLAVAGLGGTILAGVLVGMKANDLEQLAVLMAPALALTVIATGIAVAMLGRSSVRVSTVAVAILGAAIAVANLVGLALLMLVSPHDATLMGILLIYAAAAGVGAALALGRERVRTIDRLASVALQLGRGNASARVGPVGSGGPELETLARTLDDMADHLQKASEREREVESRRRDLMTAISHDLRTPLSSLQAMIEAIDDRIVEDPPTLRRYTSEMRASVSQLVTMVGDLFELAQLDAGAIEAETRRAFLRDVVRSAVGAVELQAEEKGLALRTDLGGEWSTRCSPRLARVLQNLLVNAVRHTPTDGSVVVEATRRQGELEVSVRDTGDGIAPEDLGRIFEPFYRADPARSGGGAGLGLALAKRIVESLGGHVEVRSAPQAGSRFCILLPVAVDG
jgi:signal transduction histidine kinase